MFEVCKIVEKTNISEICCDCTSTVSLLSGFSEVFSSYYHGQSRVLIQIVTTTGDLTDEETATALVNNTIEKFGQINTLINAAGILVSGTICLQIVFEHLPSNTYYNLPASFPFLII